MPRCRDDRKEPEGAACTRDLRKTKMFPKMHETNPPSGWCIKWSSRSSEYQSGGLIFSGRIVVVTLLKVLTHPVCARQVLSLKIRKLHNLLPERVRQFVIRCVVYYW